MATYRFGARRMDWSTRLLAGLRIGTGLFFVVMAGLMVSHATAGWPPVPEHAPAANAWLAAVIEGSPFMGLLLTVNYLGGGAALLSHASAPLGLALLSPAVAVIVLFHLTMSGDAWIGILLGLAFLILLARYARAFGALWSYRDEY